jgi:hypothetical protein
MPSKSSSAPKKAPARKPAAKKAAAKKPAARKSATSKRTLIEPHKGDRRYVRRSEKGTFSKVVDVVKSLIADRRSKAKKKVPKGQGDRGDTKR